MIQIYHNPRCSKSTECLFALRSSASEIEIINYLEKRPTIRELKSIIKKLKIKPIDLVRKSEKEWNEYRGADLTDDEVIKLLRKHPILIQRPIVIRGDIAVIARPMEKAMELLTLI